MTRWLVYGVLFAMALVGFLRMWGATIVDRVANPVITDPPYESSPPAAQLYPSLFIADLHADPLLWGRDLGVRQRHGSVDLPRLVEGNVAIQCFFVVSKTPFTANIDQTVDGPDALTPLIMMQGWPSDTWGSLLARTLHQAALLRQLEAESGGRFVLLRNRADLARYRAQRGAGGPQVAGILGVEGAHALEGDLDNLDALNDAGVRILAPAHFFDNDIGGSAHGERKGGLTALGKAMIPAMEARGMLLDLAHASPAAIADSLALTTKPVVISHTGLRAVCDNNRNIDDDVVRGVAETGGVVGVGYWEQAVCGTDAAAIVRSIRHVVDLVGVEHVALGSDFDGAVPVPFDTTGLVLIVEALLEAGFVEADIRKIMGENAARVLSETLPE